MSSKNQLRADRNQLIRMQKLEWAFFRYRQRITTKATFGARKKYVGLYKKRKIRVQVIIRFVFRLVV